MGNSWFEFVYFLKPIVKIDERLPVGDVIDEDDRMSTLVIRSCDGSEPFLTSGVPDLEFDFIIE